MEKKLSPDYKRIYSDIIRKKFPEKMLLCNQILNKKKLSVMDVIELNSKIFSATDNETLIFNQTHKAYDKASILQILDYQKKNRLNNQQLANHFKLSRNTITKWKKQHFSSVID